MTTTKESYTATEWQTLQFAPLWTFTAVAEIDKNIDQKEFEALLKEFSEAGLYKVPLVREVLGSIDATTLKAYADDQRKILDGLDDVANLLDAKSDAEEATGFKQSIIGIGQKVARASGGLFGDKMSDDEAKALAIVATHLRWVPPK